MPINYRAAPNLNTTQINPLQDILSGVAAADSLEQRDRQREIQGLQDALAGKQGQDLTYDADYQRLAALDPRLAAQAAATFGQLDKDRQGALYQDSRKIKRLLEANDIEGVQNVLENRKELVSQIGGDSFHTDRALEWFNNGEYDNLYNAAKFGEQEGVETGFLKDLNKSRGKDLPSEIIKQNYMLEQYNNPNTPEATRKAIGVKLGLEYSIGQSPKEEIELQAKKAKQIRLAKNLGERRKAAGENIEASTKTNFGIRNNLRSAFTGLKDGAATGYSAPIKEFASKIFSDIDLTNEAKVSGALTNFSLSALQKFKGPTTDFEYNIAESLTGKLKDSKTSIEAKLKALDITTFLDEQYNNQLNRSLDDDDFDPRKFKFMGNSMFKGQSINDIAEYALKNNMTVEQAIQSMNNTGGQESGSSRFKIEVVN